MKNFLKVLKIDEYSLTPYYRQLCNSILQGIDEKLIGENDTLPSINDLVSAVGAALVIHNEWNRKALHNDIIQLKYYSANQSNAI